MSPDPDANPVIGYMGPQAPAVQKKALMGVPKDDEAASIGRAKREVTPVNSSISGLMNVV